MCGSKEKRYLFSCFTSQDEREQRERDLVVQNRYGCVRVRCVLSDSRGGRVDSSDEGADAVFLEELLRLDVLPVQRAEGVVRLVQVEGVAAGGVVLGAQRSLTPVKAVTRRGVVQRDASAELVRGVAFAVPGGADGVEACCCLFVFPGKR